MGHLLFRRRGVFSISLLCLRCSIPSLREGHQRDVVPRRADVPLEPADSELGRRLDKNVDGEELRDEADVPL